MSQPFLQIRGLSIEIATELGPARVVEGVDLEIGREKILGLVGESGCGKTLTALSILRALPRVARIAGGAIHVDGRDLLSLEENELRKIRGARVAMAFQDPLTSLDPVRTVGAQIAEVAQLHLGLARKEAAAHSVEVLRQMGLPAPERTSAQRAHQLSGGMRQRVMLALALCCAPQLLILDEPTRALDASVQAEIEAILEGALRARKLAVLLITHDLGLVEHLADAVAVMYAGQIVERGTARDVLQSPLHPYTDGLLRSRQRLRGPGARAPLPVIPGAVPAPGRWPSGCRFRDRCPRASPRCTAESPHLSAGQHAVACHHPLGASPAQAAGAAGD